MSWLPFHHPDHARARELASLRIDEPLAAGDAAWLEAHLGACPPCAAVADAYRVDHGLFAPLRDATLAPPRDLWARTAAAIDADSGHPSRRAGRRSRLPLASLAPLAGLAVVAVVIGSTLLTGAPAGPGPSGPAPTAIALVPGHVSVVTLGADGRLEVLTAGIEEVCPLVAEQCQVAAPSFEAAQLARIPTGGSVDAIISPQRDQLVVVQRNAAGRDGVYVFPVRQRTGDPSPAPVGTASAPRTEAPVTPSAAVDPTVTPGPSAATEPSATPAHGGSPSPSAASGSPAPTPSRSPAATPSGKPSDVPPATPTPVASVAVTPTPDGAIEIAADVVVVGSVAAYDADGGRFAFTARPSDGSAGPDVYVWKATDSRARAVTGDHQSVFAGWDGDGLLVSRVVGGEPRTLLVDPQTGAERGERAPGAWLPAVSADGTQAVWWAGEVRLDADGLTWVPGKGELVVGPWPHPGKDARVLTNHPTAAWQVRWAIDGSAVAVWTADAVGDRLGRLSLYAVDPDSGQVRLAQPLLRDEIAAAGIALEAGQLVYAGPAEDGERGVWVFAWKGDSLGKMRLPGQTEVTVVH